MSNTDNSAASVESSDDSGNVYDFKDSKTSGVVTVTKTWEDSLSNDERPVPDISINTEKPSKSALGYVITYHGNGLTFTDGTTENEIIVNSTGKIVSGQYKELVMSSGWYLDTDCTNKFELNSNGLPVNDVTHDIDLYAKEKTYVIKSIKLFDLLPTTTVKIIFTDETAPVSASLIDGIDEDNDGGVVAWTNNNIVYISTQMASRKVIAPQNCKHLFTNSNYFYNYTLKEIDFSNFDTSKCENMFGLFYNCKALETLNLDAFIVDNVTDIGGMFYRCSSLKSIDLTSFNTHLCTSMKSLFAGCESLNSINIGPKFDTTNVTNMDFMFADCNNLKAEIWTTWNVSNVKSMNYMFGGITLEKLDLSSWNTASLENIDSMFSACTKLKELVLSSWNTSNIKSMNNTFQYCRSLSFLDISSFDTTNISSLSYTFYNCDRLTSLKIGDKFAFKNPYYCLPSGTWYASDGTGYSVSNFTVSIPNNKADTYTRR